MPKLGFNAIFLKKKFRGLHAKVWINCAKYTCGEKFQKFSEIKKMHTFLRDEIENIFFVQSLIYKTVFLVAMSPLCNVCLICLCEEVRKPDKIFTTTGRHQNKKKIKKKS